MNKHINNIWFCTLDVLLNEKPIVRDEAPFEVAKKHNKGNIFSTDGNRLY